MIHTWNRVKGYVVKAGVVIFPCCVVLTLMMTFGWKFSVVDNLDDSILASIGSALSFITKPLGFGNWQGTAASISAEIAKEQATATLAMVAGGDGSAAANITQLFKSFDPINYKAVALAFLLFNLFIPPCIVAVVNTFKEMGTKAWGWFAVGFQFLVGYTLALNAFQIGKFVNTHNFTFAFIATIVWDIFILYFIVRPNPYKESK